MMNETWRNCHQGTSPNLPCKAFCCHHPRSDPFHWEFFYLIAITSEINTTNALDCCFGSKTVSHSSRTLSVLCTKAHAHLFGGKGFTTRDSHDRYLLVDSAQMVEIVVKRFQLFITVWQIDKNRWRFDFCFRGNALSFRCWKSMKV